MPGITQLEEQGRALLAEQKRLLDDGRPLTGAKKARIKSLQADVDAILEQHAALKAVGDPGLLLWGGERIGASPLGGPRLKGLHAGLAAEGFQPIATPQLVLDDGQARELHAAAVSRKTLAVDVKAAQTSADFGPSTIADYRLPPVPARREPTRVLSLVPTFATHSPQVVWYSTTGTAAAAAVAEGAVKPTSTLSYAPQTTTVTKIAHVVEVTDETLADFSGFLQALEGDMVAGLIKAESNELLNATAVGASKWPGLLNVSGVQVQAKGTDTALDAINRAFDLLRTGASFTEPDALVLHPTDWGNIRRAKDTQARYLVDPDPTRGDQNQLWGLPVVVTTAMPLGTALVGAFAEAAVVYVRDGIRVELANQGTAQFTANTTLVRCEERLALTVPRPSALCKVTGL